MISAGFVLFIVLTVVTIRSQPVPLAQASHELRNLENHLVTFGQSSWDSFKVCSCTPWLRVTVRRLPQQSCCCLTRTALGSAALNCEHGVNMPCTAPAPFVREACVSVTVLSHLWMRSTMWQVLGCALQFSRTA